MLHPVTARRTKRNIRGRSSQCPPYSIKCVRNVFTREQTPVEMPSVTRSIAKVTRNKVPRPAAGTANKGKSTKQNEIHEQLQLEAT